MKYKYYIPVPPNEWQNCKFIKVGNSEIFSFLKDDCCLRKEINYSVSRFKQDLKLKRIKQIPEAEIALLI